MGRVVNVCVPTEQNNDQRRTQQKHKSTEFDFFCAFALLPRSVLINVHNVKHIDFVGKDQPVSLMQLPVQAHMIAPGRK